MSLWLPGDAKWAPRIHSLLSAIVSRAIVGFISMPLNCPDLAIRQFAHSDFWQSHDLVQPRQPLCSFNFIMRRKLYSLGQGSYPDSNQLFSSSAKANNKSKASDEEIKHDISCLSSDISYPCKRNALIVFRLGWISLLFVTSRRCTNSLWPSIRQKSRSNKQWAIQKCFSKSASLQKLFSFHYMHSTLSKATWVFRLLFWSRSNY